MIPRSIFVPARLARLAAAGAVVVAVASACGPAEPPPRPSASDGLVVVKPTETGGADLVGVRVADGASVMLTDSPERTKASPVWLPALERLLYTEAVPGADPPRVRMMLLDPRSGEKRGATDRPMDLELQPSASLEGRSITYVFAGPTRSGPAEGIKVLRTMNASDRLVRVSRKNAVLRAPVASPIDASFAVEVHRPRGTVDLSLMRDGSDDAALVAEPPLRDTRARFSRGGGTLYFQREHRVERQSLRLFGGGDVCGIHIETREVACIAASTDAREHAIEPSPTRDEVAFAREVEGGAEIVLSDPKGQSLRVVARSSRAPVLDLAWSPDGERLLFVAGADGESVVTAIDREGEALIEVPGVGAAWMPVSATR